MQTSLPSAHVPFVADAKIGEGVKAWRAGKYKTKSGGGDGGDSGSDGSGDESKRKRSNSSDSEDSEKHRRKKKGMTRDYLRTIPKKPLLASLGWMYRACFSLGRSLCACSRATIQSSC